MQELLKILMLEDNPDDAEIIQRVLIKAGMHCVFQLAIDRNSFLEALLTFSPAIILSDNSLPQFNSEEALKISRQKYADIPFILVTGTVSEDYAVSITKSGADDYILKDRLARLPAAIHIAIHFRNAERQKKAAIQKLIESEEKYRAFVGRITEAFIALDKNWICIYLNKQAGEMVRRQPEDIIGKNMRELFPDTIGSSTYYAFQRAMDKQQFIRNEDYYAPFNLWYETHIYPSEEGLSVFIRDISESKKAEEEIRKATERFEMVVSATNDVVWDWDLSNNALWWNQNYYTHFGYTKKNTSPDISSWENGLHSDDRERVKAGIYTSINNRRPVWTDEYRFLKADGSVCFILDCGYIQYNRHGKPCRMVGAMLDITERKLAEQELQVSLAEKNALAERVSAIVNTLPANIALLDSRGIIIEVNASWKKFAIENAYAGSDFGIGENYISISEKSFGNELDDGLKVASGIKAVLECTLNEFIFEYPCDSPAIKRWFRMVVTPLQERISSGAVVMHMDISEIRKLEQERIKTNAEEQKTITRAILNAQERERNLIGAELHDNVNQILAGTKLLLSIAQKNSGKSEEMIQQSIANLQDAIEENRKIAHNLVVPNFNEIPITDQLLNLTEGMLKKAGITVHVEISNFKEEVLEDEQKLAIYRIAQEQCTNIIKYAGCTLVNIELSTSKKSFRMSIADDGRGMEKGKLITGIGLANIESRLRLFNGVMTIDTGPGKGFLLAVKIPLKE